MDGNFFRNLDEVGRIDGRQVGPEVARLGADVRAVGALHLARLVARKKTNFMRPRKREHPRFSVSSEN